MDKINFLTSINELMYDHENEILNIGNKYFIHMCLLPKNYKDRISGKRGEEHEGGQGYLTYGYFYDEEKRGLINVSVSLIGLKPDGILEVVITHKPIKAYLGDFGLGEIVEVPDKK